MGRFSRTWQLFKESFAVLAADSKILVFPVCSGISLVLLGASFFIPLYRDGTLQAVTHHKGTWDDYAVLFAWYYLNFFVGIFFNSALMGCANMRLSGRQPTVGAGFRIALSHLGRIAAWALVAASVGMVLSSLRDRNNKLLSVVAAGLNIAWSLVTYLIVPVLLFEDRGVFASLHRSSELFRSHWGEQVAGSFGFGLLSRSGPLPLSNVMLDKFAPKAMVHLGDAIMAALLSLLLLINAARMFLGLTRDQQIPARLYFAQIGSLIVQGVTQMQWKNCNDSDASRNWIRHLFLVSGYATIFTLVVVFLPWFQIQDSSFHWTSILGYYSTAVLLVTTAWMVLDRIGKRTEMHRFSHLSDWLFPILLFLTAVTGILVNIFRLMNLPMPTYVTYVVHMAIAVPMLVVEVPFGKWSHLLYRPLGIFVATVKRKALESASEEAAVTGQALASNG